MFKELIRKKVKVGNDQEIAQPERNPHSTNRGVRKKTKMTFRYRQPSEQLFPNKRPLTYPNLTENMKTYIRLKQHKNSTPKHRTCVLKKPGSRGQETCRPS